MNQEISLTRCCECGLLSSYIGVDFTKNNNSNELVCSTCREFQPKIFPGEKSLVERITSAIGSSDKVAVTVSGGKDSLFVWEWLVSNFGSERVVALNHHKVGLVHPLAMENMENASSILGSILIKVDDYDFLPRFRRNLSAFLDNPEPGMVRVALCAGCRAGISAYMFEKAEELGIKTVINGASYLELAPFKSALLQTIGKGCETKGLLTSLGKNDLYYFEDNLNVIIRDHHLCHNTNLSQGRHKDTSNVDFVDFFNYVPNIPYQIKSWVTEKLDWSYPEDTPWHFDCDVEIFKHFFYFGSLGYTEYDFKLASMVRHGLMSREESIRSLNTINKRIIGSLEDLLKKLRELNCNDLSSRVQDFYISSKYFQHASKLDIEAVPLTFNNDSMQELETSNAVSASRFL